MQRPRNADYIGCEVTDILQKMLTSCSVESKSFLENRN